MKKLMVGAGLGWFAAWFLDPARGRARRAQLRDRPRGVVHRLERRARRAGQGVSAGAYGLVQRALHRHERPKDMNDATLAHKVETEIFRPEYVPKGQINVNVEDGKVVLRGEVGSQELIEELVDRARGVQGVREVESLLHLPSGTAPEHV